MSADVENSYVNSRYKNVENGYDDLKPLIELAEKIIRELEKVVKNVKLG